MENNSEDSDTRRSELLRKILGGEIAPEVVGEKFPGLSELLLHDPVGLLGHGDNSHYRTSPDIRDHTAGTYVHPDPGIPGIEMSDRTRAKARVFGVEPEDMWDKFTIHGDFARNPLTYAHEATHRGRRILTDDGVEGNFEYYFDNGNKKYDTYRAQAAGEHGEETRQRHNALIEDPNYQTPGRGLSPYHRRLILHHQQEAFKRLPPDQQEAVRRRNPEFDPELFDIEYIYDSVSPSLWDRLTTELGIG